VVAGTLQAVAVVPNPFTVARRGTVQLTAVGTFSPGGLVVDVTRQCAWTSSNRKRATVSRDGRVTGAGAGAVTITAKKGNRSGLAAGEVQ
jgi:uncharacterized protein YjdB